MSTGRSLGTLLGIELCFHKTICWILWWSLFQNIWCPGKRRHLDIDTDMHRGKMTCRIREREGPIYTCPPPHPTVTVSLLKHWCTKSGGVWQYPLQEEMENPLQYSCLESPMDRGAWRAAVHRVAKSRTWLKWLSVHTTFGLILEQKEDNSGKTGETQVKPGIELMYNCWFLSFAECILII